MTSKPTLHDVLTKGATSDNPFIAMFSKLELAKSAAVAPVAEAPPLTFRGNDPLTRAVKALARAERRSDPSLGQGYMCASNIDEMGGHLALINDCAFDWLESGIDVQEVRLEVDIIGAALCRLAKAATKAEKAKARQHGAVGQTVLLREAGGGG